jgi:hypothetical protein
MQARCLNTQGGKSVGFVIRQLTTAETKTYNFVDFSKILQKYA